MNPVEEITCILCRQSKGTYLFEGHDRMHGVEGDFVLMKCEGCGLVWVRPFLSPKELDKYYPEGYICYPDAIEDDANRLRRKERQFGIEKRVQRVIAKAGQVGKVLDVGCATGIFLNAMRQHGWECYGVEPSAYASEYARNRFGLDVFTGFLEETQYPEAFFDAITMWDVFEHMANPREVFSRVWRYLKPGGVLVVCTPNSSSWERSVFGKYWAGWEVPRHFYIYGQENISRLLKESHFEVQEVSSFTGRHGVLVISIDFWLAEQHLPAWLKKKLMVLERTVFARALTYPYFMLADRLNKSSIMTVFARKKV